jgi:hypothetical protein
VTEQLLAYVNHNEIEDRLRAGWMVVIPTVAHRWADFRAQQRIQWCVDRYGGLAARCCAEWSQNCAAVYSHAVGIDAA